MLLVCALQETQDPPEALSCIPSLQLSDIPKRAATIPTELSEARRLGLWCQSAMHYLYTMKPLLQVLQQRVGHIARQWCAGVSAAV